MNRSPHGLKVPHFCQNEGRDCPGCLNCTRRALGIDWSQSDPMEKWLVRAFAAAIVIGVALAAAPWLVQLWSVQ